ncbi:CRISPR-associated protein Csb2 [Gordonia humi]|uniref:CRISPR-associated protein Csb2 n=1 Tax=Gordonia humi TaxID=686429 RepID=A0A840EW08_9ACTN|nr:CRISPR-associated protein Csb2 [Gordonia humi]
MNDSMFHGLRADRTPEWPPSPVRLIGALLSGAHQLQSGDERTRAVAAIQDLSETPPPVIRAPNSVSLDHPSTYTEKSAPPTSKITANELKAFLDLTALSGLSTSSRTQKPTTGRLLSAPMIVYDIGDLPTETITGLRLAATSVGYFGRSQDHAVVSIEVDSPVIEGGIYERYIPEFSADGRTRGWTPGTVDWFDRRHDAIMLNPGRPLPSDAGAFRSLSYRPHGPGSPASAAPAEAELTPVLFSRTIRPSDVHRILRRLSADDTTEMFPLVSFNVRYPKCYGVAVRGHVTDRLAAADRIHEELGSLTSEEPSNRLFEQYSRMRPSRLWVTATPIRAFGHRFALADILASAVGAPVEVLAADTRPLDAWQQKFPDLDLTDGLSQWFVKFTTADDVEAPLRVGAELTRGFGLCVPIPGKANTAQ